MLEGMHDLLSQKFKDRIKAWDALIEFLAVDNCGSLFFQLDHKFEWLFWDQGLAKNLMDVYDHDLLRSDFYDHLGEMYHEKIPGLKNTQKKRHSPILMAQAQSMVQNMVRETEKPQKILDPAAGTGRLLMAVHNDLPNAVLFGVESNLRLLRIALTNFVVHGIKALLLHADINEHEIDISSDNGRHNWQHANKWYSCMDRLKEAGSKRLANQIHKGEKALLQNLS